MATRTTIRRLSPEDILLCDGPETILHLFRKLGYQVEREPLPVERQEIGLAPSDEEAIRRLFLLADHEGQFQILLFELNQVSGTPLRSLAQNFLKRGGFYLFVVTSDYNTLIFANPRRAIGAALTPSPTPPPWRGRGRVGGSET